MKKLLIVAVMATAPLLASCESASMMHERKPAAQPQVRALIQTEAAPAFDLSKQKKK